MDRPLPFRRYSCGHVFWGPHLLSERAEGLAEPEDTQMIARHCHLCPPGRLAFGDDPPVIARGLTRGELRKAKRPAP